MIDGLDHSSGHNVVGLVGGCVMDKDDGRIDILADTIFDLMCLVMIFYRAYLLAVPIH